MCNICITLFYTIMLAIRDSEVCNFTHAGRCTVDDKEISKILDMNETAIRVALSRARKTLKTKLTQLHNHGIKKN